MHGQLKDKIGS